MEIFFSIKPSITSIVMKEDTATPSEIEKKTGE